MYTVKSYDVITNTYKYYNTFNTYTEACKACEEYTRKYHGIFKIFC